MTNPSPYFQYTVGLNNVGSYQASARPWIESAISVPVSGAVANAAEVNFPHVTKFVTIRNDATGSDSEQKTMHHSSLLTFLALYTACGRHAFVFQRAFHNIRVF